MFVDEEEGEGIELVIAVFSPPLILCMADLITKPAEPTIKPPIRKPTIIPFDISLNIGNASSTSRKNLDAEARGRISVSYTHLDVYKRQF